MSARDDAGRVVVTRWDRLEARFWTWLYRRVAFRFERWAYRKLDMAEFGWRQRRGLPLYGSKNKAGLLRRERENDRAG